MMVKSLQVVGCFSLVEPGLVALEQLTPEFLNVGDCLTHGDLALESDASVLPVA